MATNENASANHDHDANRDPLSHAPGAHPVGTGVGAAGVGTAATVVGGALGGPVGAAVGAAVGAVAGGLIGKGIAEKIDPTVEDTYWRENHHKESYAKDRPYEHYAPAYRAGYEGYMRHGGASRRFEDAEPHMRAEYDRFQTQAGLINWEDARLAAHAAWRRVDQIHGSGSGMGAGPTAG